MRKLLFCLLLIPQLLLAQEMTVMSYNIRYATPNDGENYWEYRKRDLVELIKMYSPDVFGVQEATHLQMQYLDSALTNYAYVGVGRDDGKTQGEYSAIFYQTSKIEVIESETFWLSESPEVVSKGWDAALPRVCTWAKLEHIENEQQFYFFNTHFDHRGAIARLESAKLLISKIKELNTQDLPAVLTGDFNAQPDSAPIQSMNTSFLVDPLQIDGVLLDGPKGTFSGFDLKAKLINRIDYIFIYRAAPKRYAHLDNKRPNGLWISDHLPVFTHLVFHDSLK